MCWCYWGLLGVLHVRGSLNNLRVSRTHGLSYYIVCCINILRVSCCIISKLLALLFSIGIFSMSVNSDSIFLLNRSFLFCMTGFAYHMNSHTFFAKDSFLCQHYMKKSIILHKLNFWWGRSCLDLKGVKRTLRFLLQISLNSFRNLPAKTAWTSPKSINAFFTAVLEIVVGRCMVTNTVSESFSYL